MGLKLPNREMVTRVETKSRRLNPLSLAPAPQASPEHGFKLDAGRVAPW